MRRFLAILGWVILLTLTEMALTIVVGAVILLLSCLPEIWEILMRTLFAVAFVSSLLSAMPAVAGELEDLQQRVDDLEMRLDDLELARTSAPRAPLPQPDLSIRPYVRPLQVKTPRGDDCEGACAILKSQRAVSEYYNSLPNCRPGTICTDGPLLQGDGKR